MSRHPRLDAAIVVTDRGLEIVPASALVTRAKLMTREHAEATFAALTKDPVAVVVRDFGPEGHRV